jgi:acyl carrier protein
MCRLRVDEPYRKLWLRWVTRRLFRKVPIGMAIGRSIHRGKGKHMENIKQQIKSFILEEFLAGEAPENLTDSTPLITGAILDSLATLRLVDFLETTYKIKLQAHETDFAHMNTITDIARLVETKKQPV